jgi:hypothetical protein
MTRDRLLAVALALTTLALLAILFLGIGCAASVDCPLGTYPRKASVSTQTTGSVSVLTETGNVERATATGYECAPICPRGSLTRLHEGEKGRRLECVPIDGRDGGSGRDARR